MHSNQSLRDLALRLVKRVKDKFPYATADHIVAVITDELYVAVQTSSMTGEELIHRIERRFSN